MNGGSGLSSACIIFNLEDMGVIALSERWGEDHFSVPHKTCMNNVILPLSQWFTFSFISLNTSELWRSIVPCCDGWILLMQGVTMHYRQAAASTSTFQHRHSSWPKLFTPTISTWAGYMTPPSGKRHYVYWELKKCIFVSRNGQILDFLPEVGNCGISTRHEKSRINFRYAYFVPKGKMWHPAAKAEKRRGQIWPVIINTS